MKRLSLIVPSTVLHPEGVSKYLLNKTAQGDPAECGVELAVDGLLPLHAVARLVALDPILNSFNLQLHNALDVAP